MGAEEGAGLGAAVRVGDGDGAHVLLPVVEPPLLYWNMLSVILLDVFQQRTWSNAFRLFREAP